MPARFPVFLFNAAIVFPARPHVLQAAKDPLTHCWTGALEDRLVRQTERDGLKWSLLKQILKVRCALALLTRLGRRVRLLAAP